MCVPYLSSTFSRAAVYLLFGSNGLPAEKNAPTSQEKEIRQPWFLRTDGNATDKNKQAIDRWGRGGHKHDFCSAKATYSPLGKENTQSSAVGSTAVCT